MPYEVIMNAEGCEGHAVVKVGEMTPVEGGCHATHQEALDQMTALNIATAEENSLDHEALIVDIDGTLLGEGTQPMQDVIDAVNNSGYHVYLITGRDESRRAETEQALADAGVVYVDLIMQPADATDTSEFKKQAATELVNSGVLIDAAVDNDQANLDAYASVGIETYTPEAFVADQASADTVSNLRAINLKPPAFMRENAKRGLRLHEEGYSGDGLMPQTVEDARKMVAGTVTEQKWRKIGAWIARHMVDLEAVEGDEITAGLVAHLLWGSGSTKAEATRTMNYAYDIVDRLDAEKDNGSERSASSVYAGVDMNSTVQWVSDTLDERRSVAYTTLEMRASEDGNVFTGYAAIFDSPSEPMPFVEYVRKGAFAKTLNDGADVRLLIDHEGVPLARTKSGTLMLEEDDRGLRVEASLDPMNPDAQRVISAMRRGDLSQMSFAFRTIKDSVSADGMVRELREVQLFDVSVVTYPAYEDTIAELRRSQPVIVVPSGSLMARQRQIQIARHR
jgi:hypothetical protein